MERWFLCCLAILLCGQSGLWAHGDLHDQIAALTADIQRDSKNPDLFLRRGELRRLHGEFELALADAEKALTTGGRAASCHLLRGKILFDSGKCEAARSALDLCLAAAPDYVEALITRARVLVKMNNHSAAAEDYRTAFARTAAPEPDYVLELAQTLVALGRVEEAISALDAGMKKLGPIVSLQQFAIELEVQQKNFDRAIARINTSLGQMPRKESWLSWRGEIQERAGQGREAKESFVQALAALENLPASRRETSTMKELYLKATSALERLSKNIN